MDKNNKYQVKINRTMAIARVFALVSIVSAHVGITSEVYGIISKFFSYIASIGVVTFLVMSGYFFNTKKYAGILSFLKNKAKTIILPWFLFGTAAYLYKMIASGVRFSPTELARWVFGNGTYLYYLTVLMFCYFIFFHTNKKVLFSAIVINIISLALTVLGALSPIITYLNVTNYINVFNWVGFFAGGILLRDFKPQTLYGFLNKSKIIAPIIFFTIALCFGFFDVKTGYFTGLGPIYELIGTWMILSISTVKLFDKPLFILVSKFSFTVYLIHMVIIGMVDDYYNKFEITKLFSVLIVIAISVLIIYLGQIIAHVLNLEKLYCSLTGVRSLSRKELVNK